MRRDLERTMIMLPFAIATLRVGKWQRDWRRSGCQQRINNEFRQQARCAKKNMNRRKNLAISIKAETNPPEKQFIPLKGPKRIKSISPS